MRTLGRMRNTGSNVRLLHLYRLIPMLVLPPFLTRLFASQKSTLPRGEGIEIGLLNFSRPISYSVKGLIFCL